jgi:hypothetical protein
MNRFLPFEIWQWFVAIISILVGILTAGHAVIFKRDPRSAILWLQTFVLLPIVGSALYLVLGTMTPQEVLEENRGSIALRCHPIDWSAKNIPIQRKDLDWLPKEILDNETDFPIMQFSITKSTGRIVGYFDRDSSIFHIVLLDPEHNIQPAKKTNYQIQPTTKGLSQYDDLLNKLERIKSIVSDCSDKKCKLHSHISVIEELHDNIVYIGLDNDFYSTYQEILKKIPLQKILENGILVSMDNA